MKNPFKRKKPETAQGIDKAVNQPSLGLHVFAIPDHRFKPGMIIRLEENGASTLEPAGPLYCRLGMKLAFHFDPSFFGDKQYWTIEVTPDYTYRGQCFGVDDVAKLANDVGLVFPNEASDASDVRVLDDGRIAWRTSYFPDPPDVVRFAEEVQRQISGIMADYGRTKAIMSAVKRGSK